MAQTTLAATSFLDQTKEIASLYVDLCTVENENNKTPQGTARSPAPDRKGELRAAGPPPINLSPAARIAERLKQIGDSIDEKVKKELEAALNEEFKIHPSVYQLESDQFTQLCRGVLAKCSEYLHSGWEQATVVFMGMFRVVRELRDRGEDVGQRETIINNFAGETLQELSIDSWITDHGGMAVFGQDVTDSHPYVPIEGTAV